MNTLSLMFLKMTWQKRKAQLREIVKILNEYVKPAVAEWW